MLPLPTGDQMAELREYRKKYCEVKDKIKNKQRERGFEIADDEFVTALLTQISWTNHLAIMSKAKTIEEKKTNIHGMKEMIW